MSPGEAAEVALAQRIADRGREALVARLRAAYAEAAGAHADIVSIDEQRIEAMVEQAADRADGLQWRRALAGAAADELGISLTEALSNPAVAEAQQLLGAPSYEASLAELIARPVPNHRPLGTVRAAVVDPEPEPDPMPEPDPVPMPEPDPVPMPEPDPVPMPEPDPVPELDPVPEVGTTTGSEPATAVHPRVDPLEDDEIEDELALIAGRELPPHVPEEDQLRVSALHLGGVANLAINDDGLGLRLSSDGLDIMQSDDEIVGRLTWLEIDELEVPAPRGRLRRSARGRARLTIRTRHGDASFEIPAFSSDELRDRLDPLIQRYGRF